MMSAPVSAQQIAQQKLQDQVSQPQNKAGASKFDGVLQQKVQDTQMTAPAEKARMDPLRLIQNRAADRVQSYGLNGASGIRGATSPTRTPNVSMKEEIRTLQSTVGPEGRGVNIAVQLMSNIEKGQGVMDRLISEGLSGRHFNNSELLALQAGMYKYTQELELTGKVVEKATTGLKDTLKTQV
jgi:hypothetical protein